MEQHWAASDYLALEQTAHALKGDREKCLAAGMDEYISKPINPAGLKDTLEKFI